MLQAVGLITSRDQWWEKRPKNQNIASRVEHTARDVEVPKEILQNVFQCQFLKQCSPSFTQVISYNLFSRFVPYFALLHLETFSNLHYKGFQTEIYGFHCQRKWSHSNIMITEEQ